jgi:hypothetical protein
VSTIKELLGRKVEAPVWETDITASGNRRADYTTSFYPKKLALTSPTSGCLSVGIVRSRTQPTEFVCYLSASYRESPVIRYPESAFNAQDMYYSM